MTPSGSPGLRGRTLRSFLLLGVQRVVGLVVTAAGGIVLARLLLPEIFGVYAVIGFVVGLGVIVSDLGLGAALIQRRDLDPAASLGVASTANLSLALVLAAAIAGLAPLIVRSLGLAPDATEPLRVLALLIPLSALRMPAAILLERDLGYVPLTIAETLDTVAFHVVAVGAALAGAGVWSFVLGAIGGRLAGVAILWKSTGWWPKLRWRWSDLEPVLKFGVWFQGSAVVSLVRDAAGPTFVLAWTGVTAIGFLNWAATLSLLPLQFVSIAGKVLFPALSRLQDHPREFAEATERALGRVAIVLYPAALFLLAGADPIVRLIYGTAWLPAVPAIRFFCLAALLGGTSNVLVHALYSLGRADLVFRLSVFWAAVVWLVTLIMVPQVGFVGLAVASACMSATGSLAALAVRRLVPVRVLPQIRVPLAAGALGAVLLWFLANVWIHDVPSLLGGVSAAGGVYVAAACLLGGAAWRAELLADWRIVWNG